MFPSNNIGAELRSQTPIPTLDLATMAETIVAGINANNTQFLRYDRNRNCLNINFHAALFKSLDYTKLITIPPAQSPNRTIYVSGRIEPNSDKRLLEALTQIEQYLINQFNNILIREQLTANHFIVTDLKSELDTLSKSVGGFTDRIKETATTRISSMKFVDPTDSATLRVSKTPLARVISTVETVETGDRLETLLQAITRSMQQQDYTPEEIHSCLHKLRKNYAREDKQLQQFIVLLDDDKFASARLRLAVEFNIMEIIQTILNEHPDENSKLAAEYIRRITAMYHNFLESEEAKELELDLSSHYGPSARFSLAEELNKSGFYSCLPVWCHWQTPLLEAISEHTGAKQYHIGYRFKINGKDPEHQETAFELRLRRIEEALFSETPSNYNLTKSLTQLIALSIVIPRDTSDAEINTNIISKFSDACEYINNQHAIKKTLEKILNSLRNRINTVKKIAQTITTILKTKGALIHSRTHAPYTYYLNILPGVLNKKRAFGGMTEPFELPNNQQNQRTVYYNNSQITANTPLSQALFSIKTTVAIKEGLLYATDSPITKQACYRAIDDKLYMTQIILKPTTLNNETRIDNWLFPNITGIILEYDPKFLGDDLPQPPTNIAKQTQLAIQRTAFSILAYIALKTICQQLQLKSKLLIMLSMLRLHVENHYSTETKERSAAGIYAIAHAIEHALGQYFRTRMQGLTFNNHNKDKKFKNKGTFNALLSILPLRMATPHPPTIDNIGVLTLGFRPVTDHPELTQDTDKDVILIGHTYYAKKESPLGYKIHADINLLALESGYDAEHNSGAIIDVIKRLYDNGCRHIIYMALQTRGWEAGSTNALFRHYTEPKVIAKIQQNFPDLQLYPLTHDVFPATRLSGRSNNEDAFEILDYESNIKVWGIASISLRHPGLIPIYSLATLRVVGEENERLQSGFATYFLITDPALERQEQESHKRLNLIGANSPIGRDLIAVLRGIHYLESEAPNIADKANSNISYARPVLHPFSILRPNNIAVVGEIEVRKKFKPTAPVVLSLTAVLAKITNVLNIKTSHA